jgi:hypothetical protein
MAFETTERIIAVPADAVGTLFPALLAEYGEELSYGSGSTRTIGAFWNEPEKQRIYAASIERGSISPTVLTDGRLAYRCLWQTDLAAAFDAGQITGVEQLTEAQLSTLMPQPSTAP